jgi:uncharacterized protein
MANIEALYEKYPEYYTEKVNYLCTMHPLHDVNELEGFFYGKPHLFDGDRVIFNHVNLDNLKPDAGSEIEKMPARQGRKKMAGLISSKIIREMFEGKFKLKNIASREKFTGTCFPGGTKVFIDSDGRFHICERINPLFPIGDVSSGFDFEKIRSIYRAYNEEVIKNRCWECKWWFLCDMCLAQAGKDKEFKFDCKNKMESKSLLLIKYLNRLEESRETINPDLDDITAYIEQL